MLRREGSIRIWHDREIGAGEEWRGQIDEELEAADLILLLVSASFLASDYCYDVETRRALERHALGEARVVPVIVRPCDWQSAPFAELQAVPTNGKPVTRWEDRDVAWTEIAKGMRRAIAELRGQSSPPLESHQGRKPRYGDEEIRRWSLQLKELYRHRKDLTLAGSSTVEIEDEILDVRRLLRKGPQLRAGEFLGDGRYELLEPVGQGGFATVWRAWDTDVEEQVAVKVLHGHLSEDRSRRERFFRGARKMAELTHPHIVRVLPTGKFLMGSPETELGRDNDEVQHEVELSRPFLISETELTQEQWRQVTKSEPSYFEKCGADCPVERVSWYEAVEFANRLSDREGLATCYVLGECTGTLGGGCESGERFCGGDYFCKTASMLKLDCEGYRLPTEAEWEFATRAGTETPFWAGDDLTREQANFLSGKTVEVRSFDPNPWGLYEVHGNVWEWVWDWEAAYPASATDPLGPETGSFRVVRGGSWCNGARDCRSADRSSRAPGDRNAYLGFRLVKTAP